MISTGADRFRSTAAALPDFGAGSGGNMSETFRQFEAIEKALGEIRASVVAVNAKLDATLPHLATKAELQSVRIEVQSVRTEVESVRTEVESVRTLVQQVRADLIKWIISALIGGVVAAVALAQLLSHITWH
jgi:hypothetical protein